MKEWEKTARKLPYGRTERIRCCKNDRSQVISHSDKGYSTYCFRCGEDSREFRPHGERSLAELVQHRRELDAYTTNSYNNGIELPTDFELLQNSTPREARVWLLKSGVSIEFARSYGFGYSESLARLVMPVRDTAGRLTAVQSRAIYPNQTPKYWNTVGGDRNPIFMSDDAKMLDNPLAGRVITEDILSTMRVGRLIKSLSTLGTSLSDKGAVRASMGKGEHIYIWYDGDEAGVRGAHKVNKTLKLMGLNPIVIETDKDPKEYNNGEIKEIIRSSA